MRFFEVGWKSLADGRLLKNRVVVNEFSRLQLVGIAIVGDAQYGTAIVVDTYQFATLVDSRLG